MALSSTAGAQRSFSTDAVSMTPKQGQSMSLSSPTCPDAARAMFDGANKQWPLSPTQNSLSRSLSDLGLVPRHSQSSLNEAQFGSTTCLAHKATSPLVEKAFARPTCRSTSTESACSASDPSWPGSRLQSRSSESSIDADGSKSHQRSAQGRKSESDEGDKRTPQAAAGTTKSFSPNHCVKHHRQRTTRL